MKHYLKLDSDGSRPQDTTLEHYTEQRFLKLLKTDRGWFDIVKDFEKTNSGEWGYTLTTYYVVDDNGMKKLSLESLKSINPDYPILKIPMEVTFQGNVSYEDTEIAADEDYKNYRTNSFEDYVDSSYRIKPKQMALPIPLYLEVDNLDSKNLTNKEICWFKNSLEKVPDEFFKTLLKFLSKELQIPMEGLKDKEVWKGKIIPLENIFIENDGDYFKEDLYSLEEFDVDYNTLPLVRKNDLILYFYERCIKFID